MAREFAGITIKILDPDAGQPRRAPAFAGMPPIQRASPFGDEHKGTAYSPRYATGMERSQFRAANIHVEHAKIVVHEPEEGERAPAERVPRPEKVERAPAERVPRPKKPAVSKPGDKQPSLTDHLERLTRGLTGFMRSLTGRATRVLHGEPPATVGDIATGATKAFRFAGHFFNQQQAAPPQVAEKKGPSVAQQVAGSAKEAVTSTAGKAVSNVVQKAVDVGTDVAKPSAAGSVATTAIGSTVAQGSAAMFKTASKLMMSAGAKLMQGITSLIVSNPVGLALGGVAAAATGAAAALGAAVVGITAFVAVMHSVSEKLRSYSPELSLAMSKRESAQTMRDIGTAKRFGPDLARVEDMGVKVDAVWGELKALLLEVTLFLFDVLEPVLDTILDLARLAIAYFKMLSEQVIAIYYLLRLQLIRAGQYAWRALKTQQEILELTRDLLNLQKGDEVGPGEFSDPFLRKFLSMFTGTEPLPAPDGGL